MTIEYRPIKGYSRYRVGSDGSVWAFFKSTGWKMRRLKLCRDGYWRVDLTDATGAVKYCAVHRLVLEAFVGPCPEGMEGCHDPSPDKSNNALSNLKWGTKRDNAADRIRHGNQPRGVKVKHAKLTPAKAACIRILCAAGHSQIVVGRNFGVCQTVVSKIVLGKIWREVASA